MVLNYFQKEAENNVFEIGKNQKLVIYSYNMENMKHSPSGVNSPGRVLKELAQDFSGLLMVNLMSLGTQGIQEYWKSVGVRVVV